MVVTGTTSGSGSPVKARTSSTRSALTPQSSAISATDIPSAACRATSAYSLAGISGAPLSMTQAPGPYARGVTASSRHSDFAGRWEWTFGGRRDPRLLVDFTPSASLALERFWATLDRHRASVGTLTEEQLDTVGLSQYPYGSDPHDAYIGTLANANLELIHHMAEIALLRDLWRARGGA